MNLNPKTSRRTLLLAGAGLASVSATTVSGCSKDSGGAGGKGNGDTAKLLPTYKAGPAPKADLPGDGKYIEPGYLSYPAELTDAVPEKAGKGGTYKTSVMYWGDPQPDDSEYMKAVNADMGATMSFLNIPAADYEVKISALLAGGANLPDLVTIPGWGPPTKMYDAYDKAFADLTPELSGDNVLKYPNLAAIPTNTWNSGIWGGRLAAVPSQAPAISYVTLYRRDLFDKQGVKAPTSSAEFEEVCRALTRKGEKRFAIGYPLQTAVRMYGLHPVEYPWGTEDGKMTHLYEQEQFPDVLEWCRKMVEAGYVHPEIVAGQGDSKALFKGGQIAIYSDGYDAWKGYQFSTQDPGMEKGFQADGMVPFAVDGGNTTVYADGGCVFITFVNKKVTGDKLQEVLRLLNYLASPFGSKQAQLLSYGIEGKTFTMKDGVPTPNDAASKQIKSNFSFTASGPRYDFSPQAPDWVKARHEWTSKTSPMVKPLDTAGMFVNMPARLAAGSKKADDAIGQIIRGRQKVSEWPGIVAAWKKSSGDQVRELYAKQVAERNKK